MKLLLSYKAFRIILVALLFGCFFAKAFAVKDNIKSVKNDVAELKAFVDSAQEYLKEKGEVKACQEFSNPKGKFRRGNQYIFVLGYDGKVLAHGGDPKAFVGKNLFNAKDRFGTPYFQLFVDAARRGGGVVSYYWPQPDTGELQYKTSYIAPVNDKSFMGAGVYKAPEVQKSQEIKINGLKIFVESAAAYVKQKGAKEAYKEFDNKKGKFTKDDWYIFVVDYNGKIVAHGGDKKRVGISIANLRDEFGAPLLTMFAKAAKSGGGVVSYYWYNYKEGGAIKFKTSYLEPLDDKTFIGAGYYIN
jgi:cytochrome c